MGQIQFHVESITGLFMKLAVESPFTNLLSDRVNESCIKILLCANPCKKENTETDPYQPLKMYFRHEKGFIRIKSILHRTVMYALLPLVC